MDLLRSFAILSLGTAALATYPLANRNVQPSFHDLNLLKPTWHLSSTGSKASFRGLGPVSNSVAWVAGSNATVLRTTDAGTTWESVGPNLSGKDTELEFRDIQAFSADEAIVLSIGNGADSRIYKTSDAGASWDLAFKNEEEAAFFNCMAFETPERGLAVSDPVDGKFRLVETLDGGETWNIVDSNGMPPAQEDEFGFSASGTCLSEAAGRWYIASGGVDPGRVFNSDDGRRWEVEKSPIAGTASGGVFSVQFFDERHGIALGGDFESPTGNVDNAAYSKDGGQTWLTAKKFPNGYRSGSSFLPFLPTVALAVGPTGSDWTIDGGRTWHRFDNGSFHAVECVKPFSCWASGEAGRVAKLGL